MWTIWINPWKSYREKALTWSNLHVKFDRMVPVRPSDFEKLIIQPDDTLAAAIIKTFVRLPVLVWKLFDYILDDAGNLSSEFCQDLRDIGCKKE